jgi:hypothetical protein
MSFTPEEARAELARRGIAISPPEAAITPEEARAELKRRGITLPPSETEAPSEGIGMEDLAKTLLGISPTVLQTPLVAAQDLQKILLGLPGISKLGLRPTPVVDRPTTGAKIMGALLAGGLGSELGGASVGAALEQVPLTSQAIGGLRRLLPRLGPALLRTGGGAAMGAAVSPEARKTGALLGLGLGTAAETVAPALGVGKRLLGAISPSKEAEDILNDLSGGERLEENSQSLATLIRNKFKELKTKSSNMFNSLFKKTGDKNIYTHLIPEGRVSPEGGDLYLRKKDTISKNYTTTLKELHDEFIKNPTFKNGQTLRSALGVEVGRPVLDSTQASKQQEFRNAKERLTNDLFHFLNRTDKTGTLANDYNKALDFHKREIIPYKSHRTLEKIAKGDIKNPRDIRTIFRNPEGQPAASEEAAEEASQNYAKALKVLDDLGPEADKRILFHELGRGFKKKIENPQKLVDAFDKLEDKGLGSFVEKSGDLENKIDALRKKIFRTKLFQKTLGAGTGFVAGGATPIGKFVGLSLGSKFGPSILKGLVPTRRVEAIGRKTITPEQLQSLLRTLLVTRGGLR